MVHEVTIRIQQRQKDIENWDLIKRFLCIYLAEVAIPHFKRKKNAKYVEAMQAFTLDELKNAKNSQNTWAEFLVLCEDVQKSGVTK